MGVLVTLFGWTLGRLDLKEKIDWRDRWEACPACRIPGAGKLFHQEIMGERTVQYMQSQLAAIYRDGQKDGEIHYQVPTSYTTGTFCYFYECKCCGHKWVKLAELEKIPLHYQDYVITTRTTSSSSRRSSWNERSTVWRALTSSFSTSPRTEIPERNGAFPSHLAS